MKITHLHRPLFFQKSTLLRGVTSAFRIFSYCHIINNLCFAPFPAYMKNMLSLRSSSYDLCGNYILLLSKPKRTTYDLNCFSYFSAKQWNALPDFSRTSFFFFRLKNKIQGRVVQSLKSKFSFILFAHNLIIGYSKRI